MKDLKHQLAEAFGRSVPAPAAPSGETDVLCDDAHLTTEWLALLRVEANKVGSVRLAEPPSLGAARMATDQVAKLLTKAGRKRDARTLTQLRDDFLGKREKTAWARIKARFKSAGLSEKTYRSLKQGGAEPVAALVKLGRLDDGELAAMGAVRLKELLGPKK